MKRLALCAVLLAGCSKDSDEPAEVVVVKPVPASPPTYADALNTLHDEMSLYALLSRRAEEARREYQAVQFGNPSDARTARKAELDAAEEDLRVQAERIKEAKRVREEAYARDFGKGR